MKSFEDFKKEFTDKLASMTDDEIIQSFKDMDCDVIMAPKTFYRVCNPTTEQGLWYDYRGNFTGLIHTKFDFCTNSKLEMPFDDELVGWLSAVENLDDLWAWFTKEDIFQLQKHGWFIHEYEVHDYKLYHKFNHYVIHQDSSKPVRRIDIGVYVCLNCKLETLDYVSPCPPFKNCQCCSPHHPVFYHHKDIN